MSASSPPNPSLAATLAARAEAEAHVRALWPDDLQAGEFYELRWLTCSVTPARVGGRRFFRSRTELVTFAMRLRHQSDVFIGVGLRRCPHTLEMRLCPCGTRGKDHIARVPAAWADLDVQSVANPKKAFSSLDSVLEMLQNAVMPPDIIIGSGVDAHAYWTLPEPTVDLARVEALNRAISRKFRGDTGVIDADGIVRLAGTFNFTYGHPLPVRLLQGLK